MTHKFGIALTVFLSTTSVGHAFSISDIGKTFNKAVDFMNSKEASNLIDLGSHVATRFATAAATVTGAQFNQMGENFTNFVGNPKTMAAIQNMGNIFGRNLGSAGQGFGSAASGVGMGVGNMGSGGMQGMMGGLQNMMGGMMGQR